MAYGVTRSTHVHKPLLVQVDAHTSDFLYDVFESNLQT